MIPTALGLMALDLPLVRLLFERGVFTVEGSRMTAEALFGYAPGLIAFSVHAVLASAFFATKDPRTPLLVGVGMLVANVFLDLVLVGSWESGELLGPTAWPFSAGRPPWSGCLNHVWPPTVRFWDGTWPGSWLR